MGKYWRWGKKIEYSLSVKANFKEWVIFFGISGPYKDTAKGFIHKYISIYFLCFGLCFETWRENPNA